MGAEIKIVSTKDYNRFNLIAGNRPVNERHIKELIVSMTEEECVSPIQVNEKYEIIDGQHRFRALVELKKPVHYYVVKGAGLQTVQRLNSYTKNWTTDNYLDSYVDAGYEDYIKYKGFKEMYKFGNSINILLLTGSIDRGTEETKFKNGQFKVKSLESAVENAMKLEGLAKYIPWYKERSWCYAVLRCLKTKGFDYNQFLHKCSGQQRKLVKCANTEQYIAMIEEVYNYHSNKNNKITLRTIK